MDLASESLGAPRRRSATNAGEPGFSSLGRQKLAEPPYDVVATETWLVGDGSAQLSPSAKIPAGAEKKVELTITDPIWRTAALMPVGESRLQLTGTLVMTNGKGGKNYSTIQAFVLPDNF